MNATLAAAVACAVLVMAVGVPALMPLPVRTHRLGSTMPHVPPPRVRTWITDQQARRRRRVDHDLAVHHAVAGLARSLRAGHSLSVAVRELDAAHGYLWSDLRSALRRHERGETLHDALAATTSPPAPTTRLLARSLTLATRPSLSDQGRLRVLDLAAAVALDRSTVRAERRSQSAQARLSALVLTWVPLVVCGLAATTDEAVRSVLIGTTLGTGCLVAGTMLLVAGHLWIRRLADGGDP